MPIPAESVPPIRYLAYPSTERTKAWPVGFFGFFPQLNGHAGLEVWARKNRKLRALQRTLAHPSLRASTYRILGICWMGPLRVAADP